MPDANSTKHAHNFKDLTGREFGKLKVLGLGEPKVQPGGKRFIRWRCLCSCGTESLVVTASLNKGTVSCGCYRAEWSSKNKRTHGQRNSRAFNCWSHMITRCTNPNNKDFHHYGGRGIQVCDRWRNSFQAFLDDMGHPPEGCSIDRYPDNNGNYEPGNCRWATQTQQARNKRTSRMLTLGVETLSAGDWSDRTGIPLSVIHNRLTLGWSDEQALTHPYNRTPKERSRNRRPDSMRFLTHDGITLCLSEWAERVGLRIDTLHKRLTKHGWSVEKALTTHVRHTKPQPRQSSESQP